MANETTNIFSRGAKLDAPTPPKPTGVQAPKEKLYANKGQTDVGVVSAFFNPLPNEKSVLKESKDYNPDYKPTFGEEIASALSPVTVFRHWDEANQLQGLRQYDRPLADKIEFERTGKNISDIDLLVKKNAATAEIALTALPFFTPAKAVGVGAKVSGAAGKIAEIANPIMKGSELAAKTGIFSAVKGAAKASALGTLYGGLYGLHSYDGDWTKAAETAAWGAGMGVAGLGFMKTLGFIGKKAVSPALKAVMEGAVSAGKKIKNFAEDTLPTKVYSSIFGVEAGFKKIAKESGVAAADLSGNIRKLSIDVQNELGEFQAKSISLGLVEPPSIGLKKFKKTLKEKGLDFGSVGGDKKKMAKFMEILEGEGVYADPKVQEAAIKSHPALEFLDFVRQSGAKQGVETGVLKEGQLDPAKFVPHNTPLVEIKPNFRKEIDAIPIESVQQRVEAYRKALPELADAIDYSVNVKKIYNSELKAWHEYDDFMKLKTGQVKTDAERNANTFLQGLVNRDEFPTIEAANAALQKDLKQGKSLALTDRASSLDFNREVNLPWYDPDAGKAFMKYGADSIERFATARSFGPLDEGLQKIIDKVSKQELGLGKAQELSNDLEDLIRATFGTQRKNPGLDKVSDVLRKTQVLKLSFSAIQNLTQTANTLLAADFGSTLKGISTAFKDENILKSIKSGVLSESFMRQALEYSGGKGKFSDKFLKFSGFTKSELINRAIAANTSNFWVEKNFARLLKEGGMAAIESKKPSYWALKELGIDVEAAVKRGSLTAEDKTAAAFRFVERTQFTGSQLDLPYFASHPVGRVVLQFKTFAYQQSKLVITDTVNKIKQGNVIGATRNLMLLGTLYPMNDAVVKNVRSVITQEKAPDLTDLNTYVNNIYSAGNFGIVADLMNSIYQDRGAEFFFGASSNDIADYLRASMNIVNLDPDNRDTGLRDFTKQLLRSSGVGRPALNIFMPSKQPGQTTLQRLF